MFRTCNIRGKTRSKAFQIFIGSRNGKLDLSVKQIKWIEDSTAISLAEKIELFLVALGNKLTTELYMEVHYNWDEKKQIELPREHELREIDKLLTKLPFQYFKDTLPKKNRQNEHPQQFYWFQVSVNQAVSEFMKMYPDDLTEFEEGVLYGFPLSAIRAFNGLIETRYDKPTPASSYLSGVCSKDFWVDEQEYYQLWWERLRQLSPKTIALAEKEFLDDQKKRR